MPLRFLRLMAQELETIERQVLCPILANRVQGYLFNDVRFDESASGLCSLTIVKRKKGEAAFLTFDKSGVLTETDIRLAERSDEEIRQKVGTRQSCKLEDIHHHMGLTDVHLSGCSVRDIGGFMQEMGY